MFKHTCRVLSVVLQCTVFNINLVLFRSILWWLRSPISIAKTLLQTQRTSYVQRHLNKPHRPSVPNEICAGNPSYQVPVYCPELAGGLGDIQAQGTDLGDLHHKPFSLSLACFNL